MVHALCGSDSLICSAAGATIFGSQASQSSKSRRQARALASTPAARSGRTSDIRPARIRPLTLGKFVQASAPPGIRPPRIVTKLNKDFNALSSIEDQAHRELTAHGTSRLSCDFGKILADRKPRSGPRWPMFAGIKRNGCSPPNIPKSDTAIVRFGHGGKYSKRDFLVGYIP